MANHATKEPTCRVGDVFPADDARLVAQARFIVASQALVALARVLGAGLDGPTKQEVFYYLLLYSIGAANEASIAFQEADQFGAFGEVEASDWAEMHERLARLRRDCDHKNPESLRERLIRMPRNKVGFHWDSKILGAALANVATREIPAFEAGSTPSIADTALPLTSTVIGGALEILLGSADEPSLAAELASYQGDIFHLSHAVYSLALSRAAGERGVG